jgi:hypothetical protein
MRVSVRALALTLVLAQMEAVAYLQRPAHFNGRVHRLLLPPTRSSAATWGAHVEDVEERLLPYAQIMYPLQFSRVGAFVTFNVSFVYLARPGIRRVFVRLHWGDTTQHSQMPWGEFDVPYDELTGRPKPLLGGLPIQATSALVSVVLIFHEVGALHGRDVTASTQFAAVDAYFTDRLRPGLDVKHGPTGELMLFSIFDRGVFSGGFSHVCGVPLHGCGAVYDEFVVRALNESAASTTANGIGSPLPASATGLGPPRPQLPTSAPGLGSPRPHLHRE